MPMVLILDDDHFLLEALQRNVIRMGYKEVKAVLCPADALALMDEGYRPNLVLSDLQMPIMDGDAFCTLVKERCPECPVVLLSGSPEVYRRGQLVGADYVTMKPITLDTLESLLEKFAPLAR